MAQDMIKHKLGAVVAKGAHEMTFVYPSCYIMVRKHHSTHLELRHAIKYQECLLTEGRSPLRKRKMVTTNHDLCDLGRAALAIKAPDRVIRDLP